MAFSFSDTELCVKCGLCLPHCPTYALTQDESESPRGRLALIQAWAAGQLKATSKLVGHIDHCLLCRACEAACPAQVPYGRLIDDFRAKTTDLGKSRLQRLRIAAVRMTLERPALSRKAHVALPWLKATGMTRVLGLEGTVRGLPGHTRHSGWIGEHAAQGPERGRVGLFLGCTAELADAMTVEATIRLLTRLGIKVVVPEAQGCCGAMALHAGDRASYERLRDLNRKAFAASKLEAIVTIASGCGAVIKEYGDELAGPILDIGQYLADLDWPDEIEFRPLPRSAILHTPCTLKNVLKAHSYPLKLVKRIPDLRIESLAEALCCGAAGTYQLDYPGMAFRLRQVLLDRLKGKHVDYLLTSNVGCAMHLRAGLKGPTLVMHPVALLAQQLVG